MGPEGLTSRTTFSSVVCYLWEDYQIPMYGGGNTFEGIKTDGLAQEDPQKLAEFEARIARGEIPGGAEVIAIHTGGIQPSGD